MECWRKVGEFMKKENLKKKVYDDIMRAIIEGEYAADEIISEGMLIEKYGVSKSPVREALVELCSENVLKSIPRCGYMVVRLTRSDIDDILSYRTAFEAGMLWQIINDISQEQLAELEEINRLCTGEAAVRDFWAHWEYNKQFHLKLMSFANNEFAYRSLEQALKTLTRAYAQFYWNQWGKISFPSDTKYHKDVIEAIRARDAEKAAHFLTADMQDFGRK